MLPLGYSCQKKIISEFDQGHIMTEGHMHTQECNQQDPELIYSTSKLQEGKTWNYCLNSSFDRGRY